MITFNTKAVAGLLVVALALSCLCAMIMSAGCVTAAKNTYKTAVATPTPTPTPSPTPTPKPTPEPTPGPVVTLSNDEMIKEYNGLHQGEWLTWRRLNASNANGKGKDMVVHVTVYGNRMETVYQWWTDSWARWVVEKPKTGHKFLFVYVNMWMDDASDPRMYGMGWDHFLVQYKGELIAPDTNYQKNLLIKELEETWDLNKVDRIVPYGYKRVYDFTRYQWTAEELGWLRAGKSNNWDGFILYQVPREATKQDLKVLGRFDNLGGYAWWQLE